MLSENNELAQIQAKIVIILYYYYLKISLLTCLKDRRKQRGRQCWSGAETEIWRTTSIPGFPPQMTAKGWPRLEPEACSSFLSSHLGARDPSTVAFSCSLCRSISRNARLEAEHLGLDLAL